MAFFCTVTGNRILAPGISKAAGGEVPEHDGTDLADEAEHAARAALAKASLSAIEGAPSAQAIAAAVAAALKTFGAGSRQAAPAAKTPNK